MWPEGKTIFVPAAAVDAGDADADGLCVRESNSMGRFLIFVIVKWLPLILNKTD